MRFRIVKRGDGKFKVQSHDEGFFSKWGEVFNYSEDYPLYHDYQNQKITLNDWYESSQSADNRENVFGTLELAQAKMQKCIDDETQKILKQQIEVIEEVEV